MKISGTIIIILLFGNISLMKVYSGAHSVASLAMLCALAFVTHIITDKAWLAIITVLIFWGAVVMLFFVGGLTGKIAALATIAVLHRGNPG